MNKAKELREKFEADLKLLQETCPHLQTQVMPFMWAPGHYSGKVEVCMECEKIVNNIPDPEFPQLKLSLAG